MGLRGGLRHLASMVLDLLATRRCPVCGDELLDGETALCISCLSRLPRAEHNHLASRFGEVISNGVAPAGVILSWFDYDPHSSWAQIIRQAKYGDNPLLARELGRMFGHELLHRYATLPVDVLLPVPMHWRKRMSRGFNQSVEIAMGLRDATGIPVGDNLTATRPHSTQTHKSDAARRHNVEGIFGVINPRELDGARVAVVDDIVTTGSTIAECIAGISTSGARPLSLGAITLGATVRRN